jgi:predicted nicotinamide N-methyase
MSELRIGTAPLLPEIRLHLGDRITTMWERDASRPPPYFAFPWVGGQAVARYLLDHSEVVRGKRVLDVGTGSGIVAIAAARAGAASVVATDIDPRAIAAARANATLNAVGIEVVERDVLDGDVDADVITIGDLCYEQPLARRTLAFVHRSSAIVILGDAGRAYFDPAGLTRVASYDVPTTADLEGREIRAAAVYLIQTSSSGTVQVL